MAFTVEAFRAWEGDEQDYVLENTGRFVHAPEYVERLAGEVGYVSHSAYLSTCISIITMVHSNSYLSLFSCVHAIVLVLVLT